MTLTCPSYYRMTLAAKHGTGIAALPAQFSTRAKPRYCDTSATVSVPSWFLRRSYSRGIGSARAMYSSMDSVMSLLAFCSTTAPLKFILSSRMALTPLNRMRIISTNQERSSAHPEKKKSSVALAQIMRTFPFRCRRMNSCDTLATRYNSIELDSNHVKSFHVFHDAPSVERRISLS